MSYRKAKYPSTWSHFYDLCERYETLNEVPLSERQYLKIGFLDESKDFLAISLGGDQAEQTSVILKDFMLNPTNDIVRQKLLSHIYKVLDTETDLDLYTTYECCSDSNSNSLEKKINGEWQEEVRRSAP